MREPANKALKMDVAEQRATPLSFLLWLTKGIGVFEWQEALFL